MKIKNLMDYPVQLDDGRMIGAKGTVSDTRTYGKKQLSERDQKRIERGQLENLSDEPAKVSEEKTNVAATDAAKAKQTGGKK